MNKGILYGVSTGPGDPELMTLKAVKCLEKADVIAAPRTKERTTVALDIVKDVVDISGKEILYLDFAMKKQASVLKNTHRQQTDMIEEHLKEGKNVAMLNLGDASLYGTFSYLRDMVREDGYETITIPGVTSFCAVAARLEQSLTDMSEPLTLIPGSFEEVEEKLAQKGTKVIMKSASALPQVIEILEKMDLMDEAFMVSNCGMKDERVYEDIHKAEGETGYFSTILVKNKH